MSDAPDARPADVIGNDPIETDNGDHGVLQVDDDAVAISQEIDLNYGDDEGDPGRGAMTAHFRKYLGIEENPRNSNRTIIGVKFGWNGVAWCAETDYVCGEEAGYDMPHTASAQMMHDDLLKKPGWKDVPNSDAQEDDIVFYDWLHDGHIDHTGCCEGRKLNGELITIEGNTTGPDGNGGVWRKVRYLGDVAAVLRPPVAKPKPAPAPAPHPVPAPKPTPKPAPRPKPAHHKMAQVELHSRGADVELLQRLLNSHGFKGATGRALVVDGLFGANTDHAVRAFQSAHHLVVDGVCGVHTWAALGY